MTRIIRAFCSAIVLLTCLSSIKTYALENSQAQDIRLNKAKLLIVQRNTNEAFRLINQNLKGPFHLDTIYFMVEYHYKKKHYLKSYRYLRALAKNVLPKEIIELDNDPNNSEEFVKKIKKITPLKKNESSILQYVANKLFDFYLKKSITPEYLPYILRLAEKYHLINYAFNFRIIDTNYALSKIEISKNNIPKAIFYILQAYTQLRKPNPPEHKITTTELQVVLAEILIKDGLAETGALIMKSASLDDRITPELKEYIQTYSDTIKKSFFNIIYDYQLKMKSNILQVSDLDVENGAQKTSALNHHNHLNIYYQTQINKKYSFIGGLDLVNESTLSQDAKEANFSSISGDFQIKKYKSGNTLSSFNARFDTLSGRDLRSLEFIQERSKQTFSYESFWLTPSGKWQLTIPVYLKQYLDRSSMAFSSSLSYESFNSSRWFRLQYLGEFGIQMEGESLGTTLFTDLNVVNQSKVSSTMDLESYFSLFKQINSNDFLNYQEMTIGINLNYTGREWKQFGLSAGLELKNRSFANDTSFQMVDFNLGGKYNF